MRRALGLLLALAPAACSRDVSLPEASPPRVDAVQLVGLEASAPPSPLPVLAGELVAVRGGGFPADAAQLEVRIGAEDAEVVQTAADRIVVRVPRLAAYGIADLQIRTPDGFRSSEGALRYDGPGQPEGFDTSDLRTAVPLAFVAPVEPPAASGFPDLAIATGASDSALLVAPEAGIAAASVSLGLVPTSATSRVTGDRIQVLALARGGEVALGQAVVSGGALVNRVAARPLTHAAITPTACSSPQVLFTHFGPAVAAWTAAADGKQRIAAIDEGKLAAGDYAPAAGGPHALELPITGWAPWKAQSVVFTSGPDVWVYDASTPATPPAKLMVTPAGGGAPTTVAALVGGCGAVQLFYTLAAASVGGSDALALTFRAGGVDQVAVVDVTAGTVRQGLAAGTLATSVALVPDPPYAPASWSLLASGIGNLYRFRPLASAPQCRDLVADASIALSDQIGVLPTFGGMITTSSGTRLLATTADHDLVTVLPPSLTSAGPVLRLASYGGVSMQVATLGGADLPVAVAEHAWSNDGLSSFDTGSALLVVALSGEGDPVGLGGSGYARGAVWLEPATGGALAYTGDLPSLTTGVASERGGAAAVTGIVPGVCPGEDVRITGSRPVTGGPDLVAQGPARSGALGPAGLDRWGPASAPVYAAKDDALAVYAPGAGNLSCLAGPAPSWDPAACPPDATIPLGVAPLDVTLSAGDRAVAVRALDLDACTPTLGLAQTCPASDLLCLRASCAPAKGLWIARPAAAPVPVALPARPSGVAADRAGGFLVTLPCAASAAGGEACFPSSPLCEGLLTSAGGTDGALLVVAEDGSSVACVAVLPAIAGPLAVTPNGAEAWITAPAFGAQVLSRLSLARRASDAAIDVTRPAPRVAVEALGTAPKTLGAFAPGGVAFTPDGATAIVTVPGEYRIELRR